MLDLIRWAAGERRQIYLDHTAVQAAFDAKLDELTDRDLAEELQRTDETTVCCIWLHGESSAVFVFHDASQVARAVSEARTCGGIVKVDEW